MRPASVVEDIVVAAQRHSDRVAIERRGDRVTYGQFLRRFVSVADELARADVRAGDRVAIGETASVSLLEALAGALLIGATPLMLSPELPVARRLQMLESAGVHILLQTKEGVWPEGLRAGRRCVELGSLSLRSGPDAAERARALLAQIEPDMPAYIFFTSGSTGRPKGILGRHGSLTAFVRWQRERFSIGAGDRVGQITSVSFDVVLREFFVALTSGATLVLRHGTVDVALMDIFEWIRAAGLTVLHVVPSVVETWLTRRPIASDGSPLRLTFFAGEPLNGALVDRWREAASPGGEVINLYGPTETTLAQFHYNVPNPAGDGLQPVGYPLPGTHVKIRRRGDTAVESAPGEEGEILIISRNASLGYIDAPDQDKARFSSIAGDDGQPLVVYATGDVGLTDSNGCLTVRGRTDNQIKINGVRIEPGEIAAQLSQHPDVAMSFVLPAKAANGHYTLTAYWVADTPDGDVASDEELVTYLRERLPMVMVPSQYHRLGEMPLLPNGKIDIASLTAIHGPKKTDRARDELERALVEAWKEVLSVEDISTADNFFALGGDSLRAAEICIHLESLLGVRLGLVDLYENPTIASLASTIRGADEPGSAEPIPCTEESLDDYPLAPQQRRYHVTHLRNGDENWCNMLGEVVFPGRLVPTEVVELALEKMVERHDSLRSYLVHDRAGLRMSLAPVAAPPIEAIDIAKPAEERDNEIDRIRRDLMRAPIRVGRWPLFRVALVRAADHGSYLIWVINHLISDGASQANMARELQQLVRAILSDESAALPELPVRYRDAALWFNERRRRLSFLRARDFWRATFQWPYRPVWISQRGTAETHADGARLRYVVSPSAFAALKSMCRDEHISTFSAALGAFVLLYSHMTRQDDVVVGYATDGRSHPALADLIGNLYLIVPFRRREDAAGRTIRHLLRDVHRRLREQLAHQEYLFDDLMEDLGLQSLPPQWPLTTVFLNYQRLPKPYAGALDPDRYSYGPLPTRVRFQIMLFIQEYDDTLAIDCHHRAGAFNEQEITKFVEGFVEALMRATEAESECLENLDLWDFTPVTERVRVDPPVRCEVNAVAVPPGRDAAGRSMVGNTGDSPG